jgi:hypothetical protein
VLSGTANVKVDLEKLIIRLLIKIPANDDDENYQREFFRTSINVTKYAGEIGRMSLFAKTILESYNNSTDLKLQFPMKKVRGF